MSHTVYPWVPTNFLVSVHCNEPLVWFEACDFCLSYWAILWASLGYPVVSSCHGDPAAFDLHIGGPLYAPAIYRWTGCSGGSPQPCFWAWVVAFLCPHHQGEIFNTASASSSTVAGSKEQHQFSNSKAPWASSPAPTPTRPALFALQLGRCARPALLLFCPWGQLSHMLQVAMIRRERASLPQPYYHMAHEGKPKPPCLLSCPQSLLTYGSAQVKCRVHLPKCHSQWGAWPAQPLLGSQNQLSHLPQVSSGGCGCGHLSLPHSTIWQMKSRTRSPMLFHITCTPI